MCALGRNRARALTVCFPASLGAGPTNRKSCLFYQDLESSLFLDPPALTRALQENQEAPFGVLSIFAPIDVGTHLKKLDVGTKLLKCLEGC